MKKTEYSTPVSVVISISLALCLSIMILAANSHASDFVLPTSPDAPFPVDVYKELKEREKPLKPAYTEVKEGVYKDLIIIKFIEKSDIRLRNGHLNSLKNEDLRELQRGTCST